MNIYNALIYKKLYGGGGGGEIEVESLTATENKTYNAGEGKAYNPVVVAIPEPTLISKNITANGDYSASADNADGYSSVSVNVPLPSNAYLLQSIEHEQVATFTDGTDNFVKSLEVAIEPQQDLHGYDAPWVGGAGKNKLGASSYGGNYGKEVGDDLKTTTAQSYNITTNGTITVESVGAWSGVLFVTPPLEAGSYSIPQQNILTPSGTNPRCGIYITDSNLIVKSVVGYRQYGANYAQTDMTVESGDRIAYGVSNATANSSTTITNFYVAKTSDLPSGYTPYSNICPISGWDECKVTVSDDLENPTVSNVYTIDLDGTRYGGKLDVVNGVLTVDRAIVNMGDLNYTKFDVTEGTLFRTTVSGANIRYNVNNLMCEGYKYSNKEARANGTYSIPDNTNIDFINNSYSDATIFKNAMNGVKLVYELATPLTIQLSPTIIKSLQGDNNFFASTGEIELLQYWSKEA